MRMVEKSLDITPDEIEREWQNFKRKFRTNQTLKIMINYDEVKRRVIFANNYRVIRKHNLEADEGRHTYWLGVNQFTDMTEDDFHTKYSGFIKCVLIFGLCFITVFIISGADHEWDLFGAIRSQPAVEFFAYTGVRSIPTLATAGLRNLTEINIMNNLIVTIGTGAFDNLPALECMRLDYNKEIVRIAERAFTVGPAAAPDQTLTIQIKDNVFAAQGLADRTFASIGRSTALYLYGKSFTRLERLVFGQFLSDNPKNVIIDFSINCTDSGNHWIAEKYPRVKLLLTLCAHQSEMRNSMQYSTGWFLCAQPVIVVNAIKCFCAVADNHNRVVIVRRRSVTIVANTPAVISKFLTINTNAHRHRPYASNNLAQGHFIMVTR
ncbi:unnamed protein product [Medioppia subpectinata]|uniref:Cathepsin propeptide inhibitor domain-containing protein n=1 Tax=Medioppia subpectinata TaxID=1979941 RepID=A0A7R9Q2I8_9ACAR|nr:unnamed protein product [Medioppia subpectinata]CAG2109469.1 unnamed protein product [Medioppia subpectinata]